MARISIIAHFAFGAMKGGDQGHIGGVERQTSLMARWLAEQGHHVNLVTWDEDQEDGIVIDGVRVLKVCRQDAGLPGIRFFLPRWTSLIRAMNKADADLYYQNCAEYVTGQVALWCRRNRRRFVYSTASDPDCDPKLPELKTFRERMLYRYGLRHADRIIAQTERQKRMLLEGFGYDSTVLPMPCPCANGIENSRNEFYTRDSFRVVWVGRITEGKRLELLLDAAEYLKDIQFDIAGKPDPANGYTRDLITRASTLENVIYHGQVARDRMPNLYRGASVLCCTSIIEGYPNTFLEAWSHGLPVVSTFDPDNLIANRKMGFAVENTDGLIRSIRKIKNESLLWQEMSLNGRSYFFEKHSVEAALPRFESLFLNLLKEKRA